MISIWNAARKFCALYKINLMNTQLCFNCIPLRWMVFIWTEFFSLLCRLPCAHASQNLMKMKFFQERHDYIALHLMVLGTYIFALVMVRVDMVIFLLLYFNGNLFILVFNRRQKLFAALFSWKWHETESLNCIFWEIDACVAVATYLSLYFPFSVFSETSSPLKNKAIKTMFTAHRLKWLLACTTTEFIASNFQHKWILMFIFISANSFVYVTVNLTKDVNVQKTPTDGSGLKSTIHVLWAKQFIWIKWNFITWTIKKTFQALNWNAIHCYSSLYQNWSGPRSVECHSADSLYPKIEYYSRFGLHILLSSTKIFLATYKERERARETVDKNVKQQFRIENCSIVVSPN